MSCGIDTDEKCTLQVCREHGHGYNLSFIFDWNRRYDELDLVRITLDLPMRGEFFPNGKPVGCLREGAIDWREELQNSDLLEDLPTGRYHFKGDYQSSQDYYGDWDIWLDCIACTRIR